MPKFSQRSLERLQTCHPLLQLLMLRVVKKYDITVLCGHRTQQEQDEAYKKGTSKLHWPMSHHNVQPATAVDVAPYPLDWNDISRFKEMSDVVLEVWLNLDDEDTEGWKLEWGGSWTSLRDYPHFQLVRR
jgi:peptidoglycan L-alanyl-D-glutamate endopeptidase CwlK